MLLFHLFISLLYLLISFVGKEEVTLENVKAWAVPLTPCVSFRLVTLEDATYDIVAGGI